MLKNCNLRLKQKKNLIYYAPNTEITHKYLVIRQIKTPICREYYKNVHRDIK